MQHNTRKRIFNILAVAALLGATACQQAATPPPTAAPAASAMIATRRPLCTVRRLRSRSSTIVDSMSSRASAISRSI
jgi:hypothetical protein